MKYLYRTTERVQLKDYVKIININNYFFFLFERVNCTQKTN